MSINHSPQIVTNGLLFYYDMNNYKSFWGEPTVNLSYNNGQGGSEYLAASYTWTNSGTWTLNQNETDIEIPQISYSQRLPNNLRILSGMTLTTGSQHFGCGFTTISPSTQYTFSVWFRQNRAGSSVPYLRTNVNNNSLGNFSYNGSTDSSTWPVNQWIRISCTGTTQSNENGLYLSNYIGSAIGDKIWYYGHQLEAKSYATSLVAGTRSDTQALVDVTNQNTITASSLTYASDGTFTIAGASNYISITNSSNLRPSIELTIEYIIKGPTPGSWTPILGYGNGDYINGNYLVWVESGGTLNSLCRINNSGVTEYRQYPGYSISNTDFQHMCFTMKIGDVIRSYRNGVDTNTPTSLPSGGTFYYGGTSSPYQIGGSGGSWLNATVPLVRIYNRALTSNEVLQNFNALKGKYNL